MPAYLDSPFFVNPDGRLSGRHYSDCCMADIWKKSHTKVGADTYMYSG